MVGPDIEKRKNENENKNIINTQAPFHQISTEIFQGWRLAILPP